MLTFHIGSVVAAAQIVCLLLATDWRALQDINPCVWGAGNRPVPAVLQIARASGAAHKYHKIGHYAALLSSIQQ